MNRKTFAVALAVFGTCVHPLFAKPGATATPTVDAPRPEDEASQRFQKGVRLFRERSFDAALAEFTRAYEIAPDYRVLYNLAQVQAERGDYVAAVTYFHKYLKEGAGAIDAARGADVRAEIVQLEGRIARVTLTTNVPGAEVIIDGESAGELTATAVSVNSGIRRVSLRKPGYKTEEQKVTLTGGEERELRFELLPESSTTRPSEVPGSPRKSESKPEQAQASRPDRPANTGFWVSLVVTGLATGGAVTFGVLTHSAKQDFESELDRFPGDASRIDDARSRLKTDALLTDGFAALAALGLGSTIYFAVTGSPTPETTGTIQKPLRSSNLRPSLDVGQGRASIALSAQF